MTAPENILYGQAPPTRKNWDQVALDSSFADLEADELKSFNSDHPPKIVDQVTGYEHRYSMVEASKKMVERDDAVIDRLQVEGRVAVWYQEKTHAAKMREMLLNCAWQLGFSADDLAFAGWSYDNLQCIAIQLRPAAMT